LLSLLLILAGTFELIFVCHPELVLLFELSFRLCASEMHYSLTPGHHCLHQGITHLVPFEATTVIGC
jgi:hypothetical protein